MKKFILPLFALLLFTACADKLKRLEDTHHKADNLLNEIAEGAAAKEFPTKYFPNTKELGFYLAVLKDSCDFKDRKGVFVNDWLEKKTGGDDRLSFIYEYYMKCDSLRLIITYNMGDSVELSGLHMEKLSTPNIMIRKPERQLAH